MYRNYRIHPNHPQNSYSHIHIPHEQQKLGISGIILNFFLLLLLLLLLCMFSWNFLLFIFLLYNFWGLFVVCCEILEMLNVFGKNYLFFCLSCLEGSENVLLFFFYWVTFLSFIFFLMCFIFLGSRDEGRG